jgi:hypothetical protein
MMQLALTPKRQGRSGLTGAALFRASRCRKKRYDYYALSQRPEENVKYLMRVLTTAGILVGVLTGAAQIVGLAQRAIPVSPVVGVWRVSQLTTTGRDGKTNPDPQPGLLIFTTQYYSFNAVTSDIPRSDLPVPANEKQQAEAFGPFHAVSGTYEVKGGTIIFKRIAAKNPNSMHPGNSEIYTFRMEGKDVLWLSEARQNPVTWKLTRVE